MANKDLRREVATPYLTTPAGEKGQSIENFFALDEM
jgi:hypothetical protein